MDKKELSKLFVKRLLPLVSEEMVFIGAWLADKEGNIRKVFQKLPNGNYLLSHRNTRLSGTSKWNFEQLRQKGNRLVVYSKKRLDVPVSGK